jgi:hypothetical protein
VLLPSQNNDKRLKLKPTSSGSGYKICFVLLVGLKGNYSDNILESNGKFMSLLVQKAFLSSCHANLKDFVKSKKI